MNLPNSKSYANNKITNVFEEIAVISEDEKENQKAAFEKKYSNGFKTENEEIQAVLDETREYYKKFKENIADYLRTEQGNEIEQIKRTQYMLSILSDNAERFYEFSERFFSDGDFRNELKEPKISKKLNLVGTEGRFQSELVKKIIRDNNAIIKHYKDVGEIVTKSQKFLKEFRAKQFKKGNIEAQKKSQSTKKIKQSKDVKPQTKLSCNKED
ncbi:hypothetical protein [Aggregatibacter actinomycetemcomitans]|uniref:hypothetical protein n=1 Tax=Aggregatibacter actinomycetemcomitans TaxID=714 RepID=UPI00023FFC8F|nr:hypothetical protein [Aggregatibacter actinomycetemcomitans]EHK91145.1 hypothetical protein RHAA1_05091 [Aggregatibacter actinomycetemcomitans RhAA1]KNE78176.1 hypothetical protein RHAA2_05165 [Aggregatibacter actinomycetemcomitans RhAA1]